MRAHFIPKGKEGKEQEEQSCSASSQVIMIYWLLIQGTQTHSNAFMLLEKKKIINIECRNNYFINTKRETTAILRLPWSCSLLLGGSVYISSIICPGSVECSCGWAHQSPNWSFCLLLLLTEMGTGIPH